MGALDGVKVVDVGVLVQGPQAAATFAAWGAEVVKVELPGFGDQARWLPIAEGDGRSGYFIACNRGKRGVTIDLRVPAGREAFLRLIERSDVVVSNFTPGTMEGWGLSYEDMAGRNPRIIWGTGSTFGPVGPDAEREGADLSAQASGGLIARTGTDGSEPTPVAATVADHIAAQNLAAGVLAALFARERTGRGQRVETSLLGGQIWAQASELTAYFLLGADPGRANRGNPMVAGVYGIFPTSDGWLALVGIVGKARGRFFEVIGREDLNERFPDLMYFGKTKAAVFREIDATLSTRPTVEWCSLLTEAGIRHAAVRGYDELTADPGPWENGYFVRQGEAGDGNGGEGGSVTVEPPVRFSETEARVAGPVPELGQHTDEVLQELGYSADEIAQLRADGVV